MKPYECKITIDAPPSKVYAALTTEEGLRGWWTDNCEVGDGPGAQSTFRFGKTYSVVRMEKLVPEQAVHWHCVEYFLDFPMVSKTDEWVGTSMVFNLTAGPDSGTDLHFVHEGLTPELECYALCEGGWDHFLKTSLKKFLPQDREVAAHLLHVKHRLALGHALCHRSVRGARFHDSPCN